MLNRAWLLLPMAALAACSRPSSETQAEQALPGVPAAAETAPTAEDGANGVAVWVDPQDASRSLILGAGGTGGLEVYGLDGSLKQRVSEIEADLVDVRYGFDFGGRTGSLVLAYDPVRSGLIGLTFDAAGQLARLPGAPVAADDELTGLCSFQSPITGRSYALGMTDSGEMLQWEIFGKGGALEGRLVRRVPLGKGVGYCAADDATGTVYYTDEILGVLSVPGEPETDAERTIIDLPAPRGSIAAEAKGIALARGADGALTIVVADAGAEQLAAYDADGTLKGRMTIVAGGKVDAVGETEGLAVATAAMGGAFPEGILVIADQDNDGEFSNYKVVGWKEARAALGLAAAPAASGSAAKGGAHTVHATLETPPVETWGDAADDPAIWVNPRNPARSVVIATDKNLGINVYDLDGKLIQSLHDGRMNNVDVRDGLMVDGKPRTIVAASNRTSKTIALYWLDPATRKLSSAGDPVPTGLSNPYGFCMYADASGIYAFVNNGDDGLYRQWRITAAGGKAVAEKVRDFTVGSQAEGCAADDETGALYVNEEDVALWKYSAKPDGGDARTKIDGVDGPNGLVADLEAVEVWAGKDGKGYIVVSNQGADNYAVYRREGNHEFVGLFHIVADPERGIDGVSETDGLDVVSANLGPKFPQGLLVVQDGRNLAPRERQNYKFVSWKDVAESLGLE
ncbi:MAG TPA: phytase [Steroidobacteraceae bacterium]|nr:phytase [Steroidobacteraceae bacterium]